MVRQMFGFTFVVAFVPTLVFAQPPAPGPAPTVGDIQHMCTEEYPTPQSRTTIGIGETVSLWIDESTWYDPDIIYVGTGQTTVYDTIGDTIWTVTSGEGSVYPTMGSSSTLTADLAESDNTISIEASVDDSPEGDDQPVKKNINVDAKIPTGMQILVVQDTPPGVAGNAKIGVLSRFTQQVKPVSVNFSKVSFREVKGAQVINWPDGTNQNVPATADPHLPYSVTTESGVNNLWRDKVGEGPMAKGLLNKMGMYVDFTWTRDPIEHQFQNKAGWTKFNDQTHPREYKGATLQGRCGITNNGSTDWGGWQGPFQ